jgi:hypothetical protein
MKGTYLRGGATVYAHRPDTLDNARRKRQKNFSADQFGASADAT